MAVQACRKTHRAIHETVEEARLVREHFESLFMLERRALVDGFTEDCVVRFRHLAAVPRREVLRTFFANRSAPQKNYG